MVDIKSGRTPVLQGQLRRWLDIPSVPTWERGITFTVMGHRPGHHQWSEQRWNLLQGDVVVWQSDVTILMSSEVLSH